MLTKLTKQIKSKLKNRSKITKEYYRKGQNHGIFAKLSRITSECTDVEMQKVAIFKKK